MLYSPRVPPMPSDSELYTGMPVNGSAGALMAEACNALIGFRFLRFVSHQVLLTYESNDWVGYANQRKIHRVRWRPSPLADKIWVTAWVLAAIDGAPVPSVAAEIRRLSTGLVTDGPVSWSATAADLPLEDDGATSGTRGATVYRDRLLRMNWVDGVSPVMLSVDGYQGEDMELEVLATNARVYSLSVLEVADRS